MNGYYHDYHQLQRWLNRRELFAGIGRLRPCKYAHFYCSTQHGGPCYVEELDRFRGMARDRALELAACGVDRAHMLKAIGRSFPQVGLTGLETIVEAALSRGFERSV
jgi:hypothetical protein